MAADEATTEPRNGTSTDNTIVGNISGQAVMAGAVHGHVYLSGSSTKPIIPRQLPRTSPTFTDRRTELDELDRAVSGVTEQSALTVISGPGGVGKTTLAVRWLNRERSRFPDGNLYVDLGGHSVQGPLQTSEALGRFLRALGVPAENVPHSVDEQTGLYRSMTADKALSVLLDNAASAHQIAPLLPTSPTSVTVVTTRNRLGQLVSEGAHFLSLPPLDDMAAAELLRAGAGPQRMNGEPGAAQRLIELCAGLPIALTVVSAQLAARPRITLASVVRALEDEQRRIKVLATAPDLSVEAVFDHSYRELTGQTARLYRLLGGHPGTEFTRGVAAAAADCDERAVSHSLAELVEASLVEEISAERFRFHDLLQLHAKHHALQEDGEQGLHLATRRMLEWYLSNAQAADMTVRPDRRQLPYLFVTEFASNFRDRGEALDWLEANRAALIATIRAAIAEKLPELAWQMADAMWSLFLYRTYLTDRFEVNHLGIEAAVSWGNKFAEARMVYQLGLAHNDTGNHEAALLHMRRALELREAIHDVRGVVNTREAIGFAYLASGRPEDAVEQFRKALAANRAIGTRRRMALSALNLGRALLALGRTTEAIRIFEDAQESFDRTGNADAYNSIRLGTFMARAQLLSGRVELAKVIARRSLDAMRQLGSPFGEAELWEVLGDAAQSVGELDTARECFTRSFELFQDLAVPEAGRVSDALRRLDGA